MPDVSAVPARDWGVALGKRLSEVRRSRGLSQRELARRLEVSPATMSAVENGRTSITAARLTRVAEVLGAPVEELLAPAPVDSAPRSGRGNNSPSPDQVLATAKQDLITATEWRRYAPLELNAPLMAALSAFLEFGYHGATMRDIARRAGLSVPGVYHYYSSKQEMLVAILDVTMDDLLARSAAARAAGRDPVERFALLVECLALYHTHRRELGFVGASEMRSLIPRERARLANARREQQCMVDEEVEQACREGSFAISRPHEASRAVVTMCTALPQWFDGEGPATAEEIAAQYVEFALDLMRCSAFPNIATSKHP